MGGAACKPIVDTGIYTRNRVFRIVGSTKYGKALGRLKLVDTGIKWGDNFWKEHGIEGRQRREGGKRKNGVEGGVRGIGVGLNEEVSTTIHHSLYASSSSFSSFLFFFALVTAKVSIPTPLITAQDFAIPNAFEKLKTQLSWECHAEGFERTLVVPLSNEPSTKVLSWDASKGAVADYNKVDEECRVREAIEAVQCTAAVTLSQASCASSASASVASSQASSSNTSYYSSYSTLSQIRNNSLPPSLPYVPSNVKVNLRLPSCYPILDAYVADYLAALHSDPSKGFSKGTIGGWNVSYETSDGCGGYWVSKITWDMRGNRYCRNIGRHHKSNNVRFQIDLTGGSCDHERCVWRQLCFDKDCKGYKSEWREVEDERVKEWHESETFGRELIRAEAEAMRNREERAAAKISRNSPESAQCADADTTKLEAASGAERREEGGSKELTTSHDSSFDKALEDAIRVNPRDWM